MIVAKDKLGVTEYIEDLKLIESTYKGRVDTDLSVVHLSKVAEFYSKNEIRGAVIDLRGLYGSFVKVMEYLVDTFYPIAKKSGMKAQAFVITDDIIIKTMAEKLKDVTPKFNIEARVFSTPKEARSWIDSIIKD